MLADILTKPLPRPLFVRLRGLLNLVEATVTRASITKAADLVLTQPVFTTTEVAFKFPCTIHAGDMVMVNTMHTTHSKVIPFDVSLGSNITFSITMASNDRIVGARHVPQAVHKRHASQLSRVTKYIRKRERATALLHERKHKRDVVLWYCLAFLK